MLIFNDYFKVILCLYLSTVNNQKYPGIVWGKWVFKVVNC